MKGLNKLYFLKIEIDEIETEIKNLETLKSPTLSFTPHSTTISNPTEQYSIKKQKLEERLKKKIEKYIDELTRIENIIDEIQDADIRLIARYRFIRNLTWEQIGRKMHRDRSVCYKQLKKYFE